MRISSINNIHNNSKKKMNFSGGLAGYIDILPKFMAKAGDTLVKEHIEPLEILNDRELNEVKTLFKSASQANSSIMKKILEDIQGIIAVSKTLSGKNDPRMILMYPTLKSRLFYEASHEMHDLGKPVQARMISEGAKAITGTEIYPGAKIGNRMFIRHGQGVIIGDTSIIGDEVKIYHGVTLGSIKEKQNNPSIVRSRRHPKLGNDVILGCNATVLGDIEVGDHAKIGSNALVIKNVPANTTVLATPSPIPSGNEIF